MNVLMTRERITHSYENRVNPYDPDQPIEQLFENEDNSGWWSENYRVLIVPDDWDGSYAQLDEKGEEHFFTNYKDAIKFYRKKLVEHTIINRQHELGRKLTDEEIAKIEMAEVGLCDRKGRKE